MKACGKEHKSFECDKLNVDKRFVKESFSLRISGFVMYGAARVFRKRLQATSGKDVPHDR